MTLEPCSDTLLPPHLYKDDIRENKLSVQLQANIAAAAAEALTAQTDERGFCTLYQAIKESGVSWESIDYDLGDRSVLHAGSVFRIPGRPGYWVLVSPCLDWFFNNDNASDWERRVVRCLL